MLVLGAKQSVLALGAAGYAGLERARHRGTGPLDALAHNTMGLIHGSGLVVNALETIRATQSRNEEAA